jgi:hypothetical protein
LPVPWPLIVPPVVWIVNVELAVRSPSVIAISTGPGRLPDARPRSYRVLPSAEISLRLALSVIDCTRAACAAVADPVEATNVSARTNGRIPLIVDHRIVAPAMR